MLYGKNNELPSRVTIRDKKGVLNDVRFYNPKKDPFTKDEIKFGTQTEVKLKKAKDLWDEEFVQKENEFQLRKNKRKEIN